MTDDKHEFEDAGAQPGTDARKPWQAPRVLSREPIEIVAAACTGFDAKNSNATGCGLSGGTLQS